MFWKIKRTFRNKLQCSESSSTVQTKQRTEEILRMIRNNTHLKFARVIRYKIIVCEYLSLKELTKIQTNTEGASVSLFLSVVYITFMFKSILEQEMSSNQNSGHAMSFIRSVMHSHSVEPNPKHYLAWGTVTRPQFTQQQSSVLTSVSGHAHCMLKKLNSINSIAPAGANLYHT